MKLEIQNQTLHLLPEKALYWEEKKLLAIADVHIGKAESFQSLGIPLPSGSHLDDLYKIGSLINKWKPQRFIILGDWIHNEQSWTEEIKNDLTGFFEFYPEISWTLILGNHEKGSAKYLSELPIEIIEGDLLLKPFLLTHGHATAESSGLFEISGHIHPVVTVHDGPTRLRLPCFILRKNSLIIPAFGELTGGFNFKFHRTDHVYAVAGKEILELP